MAVDPVGEKICRSGCGTSFSQRDAVSRGRCESRKQNGSEARGLCSIRVDGGVPVARFRFTPTEIASRSFAVRPGFPENASPRRMLSAPALVLTGEGCKCGRRSLIFRAGCCPLTRYYSKCGVIEWFRMRRQCIAVKRSRIGMCPTHARPPECSMHAVSMFFRADHYHAVNTDLSRA